MHSVLFVCTANQCRSPMAEALFRQKLGQRSQPTVWNVASAGTWALNGLQATELAQQVMAERGLDLSQHRSRLLTAEMMHTYSLILVMENGRKEALQIEFPSQKQKVYLLSEMAGYKAEVADPVGRSLVEYRLIADSIEKILKWVSRRSSKPARPQAEPFTIFLLP